MRRKESFYATSAKTPRNLIQRSYILCDRNCLNVTLNWSKRFKEVELARADYSDSED